MSETRRLASEYRRATGKPLAVSGEIARYDASRLLGLELVADNLGFNHHRVHPMSAIGIWRSTEGKLPNNYVLSKLQIVFKSILPAPRQ